MGSCDAHGATGRSHDKINIYYLVTPAGPSVRVVHTLEQNIQGEVGHLFKVLPHGRHDRLWSHCVSQISDPDDGHLLGNADAIPGTP